MAKELTPEEELKILQQAEEIIKRRNKQTIEETKIEIETDIVFKPPKQTPTKETPIKPVKPKKIKPDKKPEEIPGEDFYFRRKLLINNKEFFFNYHDDEHFKEQLNTVLNTEGYNLKNPKIKQVGKTKKVNYQGNLFIGPEFIETAKEFGLSNKFTREYEQEQSKTEKELKKFK